MELGAARAHPGGGEMEMQGERTVNCSEVIDRIGSGPFQRRISIICGMAWVLDSMEILVVTFVLEDVAISFRLNSFEKGLIGSVSFFGMVFGAAFWSIYADKRGRRSAFVLTLALMLVAGILSALSPSLTVLCLCRIVVGFGVGGNLPVAASLVTELMPTDERAKVMCTAAGTMWGIGMLIASLIGLSLAYALGPGQEEVMWRWFLALAAVPSVIAAVAYRWLPETPRFLQVMGRDDEAVQVLEYIARVNGRLDVLGLDFSGQTRREGLPARSSQAQAPMLRPVAPADLVLGAGEAGVPDGKYAAPGRVTAEAVEAGDVRELFSNTILRRTTLCLWIMWCAKNVSYFGLMFLLPKYCHDITGGKDFAYVLNAAGGVAFVLAGSTSMWLCSEHRLGRVGAIKWSSFAAAIAFLLMISTLQVEVVFAIASVVTLYVTAIPSIVLYTFTPEFYATRYRTIGLGSASVATRVGGILAPVLAELLYDKGGPALPLIVFAPFQLAVSVAAGFIPVETAGRQLDANSWNHEGWTDSTVDPHGSSPLVASLRKRKG